MATTHRCETEGGCVVLRPASWRRMPKEHHVKATAILDAVHGLRAWSRAAWRHGYPGLEKRDAQFLTDLLERAREAETVMIALTAEEMARLDALGERAEKSSVPAA
jgi:hypothetical protein